MAILGTAMARPKTILCIASFEKGGAFMRECKNRGWRVLLVTGESLKDAAWPREAIDEVFFVPDPKKEWNLQHLILSVSYLARNEVIDRIVALDDFDVEKAAALREHLRVAGMGDTTARNFRDKLAMRGRARDAGIPIPDFVGIIHYDQIREFLKRCPPPYVLKPRLQANAIGIYKIESEDQLWHRLNELGDEQSFYLLEQFIPGTIAHVDSVVKDSRVVFACASTYGTPPMEVFHGGRVFTTRTVGYQTATERQLLAINKTLMPGLGLRYGVSHSEFILSENGQAYFLETSARVGGAHIAEMVEAATGINLWVEWARLETCEDLATYAVSKPKKEHAALMATLAQQEWPNMEAYSDPEVVWRLHKRQHAGLIIQSKSYDRVTQLLESYVPRFYTDFFAKAPAAKRASDMA